MASMGASFAPFPTAFHSFSATKPNPYGNPTAFLVPSLKFSTASSDSMFLRIGFSQNLPINPGFRFKSRYFGVYARADAEDKTVHDFTVKVFRRGLSSLRDFSFVSSVKCPRLNGTRISHESTEAEREERFSVLSPETPWEEGNIWTTFGLYMFCLHIPLGFGGLSIVAYFLHQPVLDPQTQILSLLVLGTLELSGTVFLLRNAAKPHCASIDFFKGCDSREERNWLLGSAFGFAFLLSFVVITSIVIDKLVGSEAVNNSEVKKIIMNNGDVLRTGCFALYCIIAPAIEETIYRRFLLTSLASSMEWKKALLISSGIFAGAHLSVGDFGQLFVVGCVLGCCYSWSGNLASPILVHSLYNAFTLFVSLLS